MLDGERIMQHQQLIRRVVDRAARAGLRDPLRAGDAPAGHVRDPDGQPVPPRRRQPRAAQAITLACKVRALLDGRFHVSFKDMKDVAIPAMRHRVILNFEGEAEGITTDMVLEKSSPKRRRRSKAKSRRADAGGGAVERLSDADQS